MTTTEKRKHEFYTFNFMPPSKEGRSYKALSFFDFSLVLCRVLSSGKVRGKDNFWTGLVFVASHEKRQISRSAGGVTTGRGTPQ